MVDIESSLLKKCLFTLKKIDWILFITSFVQLMIGVAFIFCIGHQSGAELEHYWLKQLFWIAIGFVALIVLTLIDYRKLEGKLVFLIFALGVLLLIFVLIPQIGLKINGARSWISLFGVGTLQPSEFAKPATLLYASWYVTRRRIKLTHWQNILKVSLIFLVPILLIGLQPDYGSSVVFLLILLSILFINGIKLKYIIIPIILCIFCLPLLYSSLQSHQKDRIKVFIHPIIEPVVVKYAKLKAKEASLDEKVINRLPLYLNPLQFVNIEIAYKNDEITKKKYREELKKCRLLRSVRQQEGYNVYQSLLAVGSGGLWGKGFLKGTQNELGFLPQKVAPTDFIFSVIAEEMGFVGSSFIILIYIIILFRIFRIAMLASSRFGRVLAMSIGVMFFIHLYINLGMTMGLSPVIGIPLPFMSYGGSFVVSSMICLGLLQSIYVRHSSRNRYIIDLERG